MKMPEAEDKRGGEKNFRRFFVVSLRITEHLRSMMAAAITITIIALCTRTVAKYTVFIQMKVFRFFFLR